MKQPTQSHSLEQPIVIEKYKPSVKQSQKTLKKKLKEKRNCVKLTIKEKNETDIKNTRKK